MKNNSAIRQLLFNDVPFWERCKLGEEHKRLMDALIDLENQVNARFGDDKNALELIQKYTDALDNLNVEESSCLFEQGVRFGVLFGMELAKE